MLVLSRKTNERIVIDGNIEVVIVAVRGGCVKLGIQAPPSVPVHRAEVQQRIADEGAQAVQERK
jgi:carbon storage regulator